jgi:hypothetical protein
MRTLAPQLRINTDMTKSPRPGSLGDLDRWSNVSRHRRLSFFGSNDWIDDVRQPDRHGPRQ